MVVPGPRHGVQILHGKYLYGEYCKKDVVDG
jgi:hypothetical protein